MKVYLVYKIHPFNITDELVTIFDTAEKADTYCDKMNKDSNAEYDDYGLIKGVRYVYNEEEVK